MNDRKITPVKPVRTETTSSAQITMKWTGAFEYECGRETIIEPSPVGDYIEHCYSFQREDKHGYDIIYFESIPEMREFANLMLEFADLMEKRLAVERRAFPQDSTREQRGEDSGTDDSDTDTDDADTDTTDADTTDNR